MSGAVIENLSNRKLFTILAGLALLQVLFFALGAFYAPNPSTSMTFLMTKCRDANAGTTDDYFYIRPPGHCDRIENLANYESTSPDVRDIVFVAQMPHVREGAELDYSPWFQYLLGYLEVHIEHHEDVKLEPNALMEFEVRMAYKKARGDKEWREFVPTTSVQRRLECAVEEGKISPGSYYKCSTLDLFEFAGSLYPFYVLNLRLPRNPTMCQRYASNSADGPNCAIGRIIDLSLIAVNQTGGFTMVWLWLKTLMTLPVVAATMWYSARVDALCRPKLLIEKAVLVMGWTMAILDFPIEWLSIFFYMPALLLVNDLRQGLFYAVLFSFWLVFAGEHLIDDSTRNNLRNYWRNLSLVGSICVALIAYDLAGRGRQVMDPFHNVWASPYHAWWAKAALNVAGAVSLVYFLFLAWKIWMVWTNIKRKRSAQLYRASETRRIKVEGVIYRFKFLMLLTVVCCALTLSSYYMQQHKDIDLDDEDSPEKPSWFDLLRTNSASAFFTSTFGMWNLYVLLLLAMYAPSHKQYAGATRLEDEQEDLMDPRCSSTEDMPMTAFLKPATD